MTFVTKTCKSTLISALQNKKQKILYVHIHPPKKEMPAMLLRALGAQRRKKNISSILKGTKGASLIEKSTLDI